MKILKKKYLAGDLLDCFVIFFNSELGRAMQVILFGMTVVIGLYVVTA